MQGIWLFADVHVVRIGMLDSQSDLGIRTMSFEIPILKQIVFREKDS